MEPISREEVLNILNDTCNHALKVYDKKYHLPIRTITLTATKQIDRLPTIESRPRGKWLRKEYYFDEWVDECSVCGEAYTMIDGTATDNGYNYCPNCGADVRGEK